MSSTFGARGEPEQGPSLGTVVWGAVVVAAAALIVASRLGWFTVDPGVAAVALLLLAGLGLVVGGVVAGARNRRRPADAPPSDAPDASGQDAGPST